jgi:hypothetical protein
MHFTKHKARSSIAHRTCADGDNFERRLTDHARAGWADRPSADSSIWRGLSAFHALWIGIKDATSQTTDCIDDRVNLRRVTPVALVTTEQRKAWLIRAKILAISDPRRGTSERKLHFLEFIKRCLG